MLTSSSVLSTLKLSLSPVLTLLKGVFHEDQCGADERTHPPEPVEYRLLARLTTVAYLEDVIPLDAADTALIGGELGYHGNSSYELGYHGGL